MCPWQKDLSVEMGNNTRCSLGLGIRRLKILCNILSPLEIITNEIKVDFEEI